MRDCKHGRHARQCEWCDLEAENADLRAALIAVKAINRGRGGRDVERGGMIDSIVDAALAAAPPADHYEQVGGLCACGFVRTEDMVPANNPLGQFGHVIPGEAPDFCGPVEPVYVRVAAPPEGEAEPEPGNPDPQFMVDGYDMTPPAPSVCPTCRSNDPAHSMEYPDHSGTCLGPGCAARCLDPWHSEGNR